MAETEEKTQALIDAARAGDLDRVRGLALDGSVSLDAEDWYDRKALMYASENGEANVVRVLVE